MLCEELYLCYRWLRKLIVSRSLCMAMACECEIIIPFQDSTIVVYFQLLYIEQPTQHCINLHSIMLAKFGRRRMVAHYLFVLKLLPIAVFVVLAKLSRVLQFVGFKMFVDSSHL